MKQCSKCKKKKEKTDFSINKREKDGHNYYCKKCVNKLANKWYIKNREKQKNNQRLYRENNPEKAHATQIKIRYGLEQEDYVFMKLSQDSRCAISGQSETSKINGKVKKLSVDHCHTTGKVRGLLISDTNKGLGMFKDDAELLRAAADYIDYWKKQHSEKN